MDRPHLSLVIVNHRTPGDVERLLASLAAHPPACPTEAIVVNSVREGAWAKTDGALPVRIVQMEANRGFGAACNRGIAEAGGEFLLPMNADLILRDDALSRLVEHLRRFPRTGIAAPALFDPDGTPQRNARRFYTRKAILARRTPLGSFWPGPAEHHLMLDQDPDAPFACDWALGAALCVRRELLEAGRLFDERYFLYFEDVDLCARCWSRGFAVDLVPAARLVHAHRRESALSPFGSRGRMHLTSLWRFWRKHGTLRPAGAPPPEAS